MTGKTHKFIGIAAGAAIVYAGMTADQVNPASLLYLIAVPMGAMLPDIDHPRAKLGKGWKTAVTAVRSLFGSFALAAVAFYLADAYRNDNLLSAVAVVLITVIPFMLLAGLSRIPKVRRQLNFIAKHRGLMHTLILPAGMFGAGFLVREPTFAALLTGVNIGYVTHIAADMMTVHGCPIFYPFSKKNQRFMRITTGTAGEYIAGLALAAVFAAVFLTGLINIHL